MNCFLLVFAFLFSFVHCNEARRYVITHQSVEDQNTFVEMMEQRKPNIHVLPLGFMLGSIVTIDNDISAFDDVFSSELVNSLDLDERIQWVDQKERIRSVSREEFNGMGKDSFAQNQRQTFQTNLEVQSNPPWHLDRIDQKSEQLDNKFHYHRINAKQPTNIYVLDTGIKIDHEEFKGRAFRAYSPQENSFPSGQDCHGHGTGVAALAVGTTYGIDRNANVHDVRIMDCSASGFVSDFLKGLEWVARNHVKPAVVNLSMIGRKNKVVNDAIERFTNETGILCIVSAGNSGADACNHSPASSSMAFTVGALDSRGSLPPFTNFGPCVDVYSPGTNMLSASHLTENSIAVFEGTSFSTPLITGIASLLLQQYTFLEYQELKELLNQQQYTVDDGIPSLISVIPEFSCEDGWFGYNCTKSHCFGFIPEQLDVCNSHGSCIGPNQCQCSQGYSGENCQEFMCWEYHHSDPRSCNGKGLCVSHNQCHCSIGYNGSQCEVSPTDNCFGLDRRDPNVCGGEGSCVGGRCICNEGYWGTECHDFNCFHLDPYSESVCSGHGLCVDHNDCFCNEGWVGTRCNVQANPEDHEAIIAIIQGGSNSPIDHFTLFSNETHASQLLVEYYGNSSVDPLHPNQELDFEWSCNEIRRDSRFPSRCPWLHHSGPHCELLFDGDVEDAYFLVTLYTFSKLDPNRSSSVSVVVHVAPRM